MKLSSHIIYLLILALLAPVAGAEALDRDAVLEKLIQSYGGEQNLHKLDSMVQEWDFVALTGNRHGKDVRSVRVPGQLRVELTYPDKKETRVLNQADSYVIFGDRPAAIAAAAQHDAMRLQLMRLYSPLHLRDRRDSLSLTLEGEYCALSLQEGGLRSDYLVDMDNWRIEKVVGTLTVIGGEMRFLTEYSDFALVDGVLVHQKENKFAGNVNTAVLQLRGIELQARLENDLFLP
jgi:hypothetical protein